MSDAKRGAADDLTLARVRAMLEAATPGPWDYDAKHNCIDHWPENDEGVPVVIDDEGPMGIVRVNGPLLAAAPALASLVLEMGQMLGSLHHWLSIPAVTNSDRHCVAALLHRSDALLARLEGKEAKDAEQGA